MRLLGRPLATQSHAAGLPHLSHTHDGRRGSLPMGASDGDAGLAACLEGV